MCISVQKINELRRELHRIWKRERAKLSIHKQCHIPDVYFVSITTETDRVEVANFLPGKQGISESL